MGSTELAANTFRATQTEKLKRDQVSNKAHANQTHFEVGAKVRATIEELGSTMRFQLRKKPSVGACAKKVGGGSMNKSPWKTVRLEKVAEIQTGISKSAS